MPKLSISIQLYTLRDLTQKNMPATLAEVAKTGYRFVELAGFGNLKTASEMAKALQDAGLRVSGAHIPLERFETELSRVCDEQAMLGNRTLIVPWLSEPRRVNAAAYEQLAKSINGFAADAKTRGFDVVYHNHDFELRPFDAGQFSSNSTGMEILLSQTDAALVKFELDVYWLKFAGQDPVKFIEKLGNRIRLLHLKDMSPAPENRFAPLGQGTLDIPAIIAAGEKAGATFGVVEQDSTFEIPPLEAIRISFDYLKKIGAV
jgi:sugar phosphate isomerase/epimerase